MKIAFLNDKYIHHQGGGAQESVRILAESLVKKGHDVSVWATSYQPGQGEVTEMHNGVRVTFLPVHNVYWPHGRRPAYLKPFWHAIDTHNPRMAVRIGRLLETEKPDVMHTNILAGFSPAVWGEAAKHKVPVVHTMRDYYLLCPSAEMFTARGECRRQCGVCKVYSEPKRFASKHVSAVVGISNHLLHAHVSRGHFLNTPIRTVIHNSYASDGSLSQRASRTGLRVGYLGRLFETKGIELLIDAVTNVESCELFIAGKGESDYEQRLRSKASKKATFLGVVPPKSLFEKIDVLVAPSLWHEPFGRIAIEAMAWGIPVVASRRGGLPEIVNDGTTGYLFEPDENGSLAPLLRNLTPEKCQSMRDACLRRASDFLPETIAGEYERLYRQVIEVPERNSLTQPGRSSIVAPAFKG